MNELYKSDVFFFITSIAVIVVGILLVILVVYLIKVFRDIKYISGKAKTEADLISQDLSELRQNVKEEGVKIKHLSKFFSNLYNKKSKK